MKKRESGRITSKNANILTIMGILGAVFTIPFSFIPIVGMFSAYFGLFGILLCGVAFYLKHKLGLRKVWPIVGMGLSMISLCLGINTYYKHKFIADFMFSGPMGKLDMILEYEEPEDTLAKPSSEDVSKKKLDEEKINRASKNNPSDNARIATNSAEDTTHTMLYNKTSGPLQSYYYSIVDKLRIRSTPETNSEVLGYLQFGEQVRYLDEKTAEKEVIQLAGKERNDYWYKITSLKDYETIGWVYGGALLNATESFSDILPGIMLKPFNFISNDSLTALIGRPGYNNFTYSGLMSFSTGNLNTSNSNGRFFFIGFSSQDHYYTPGHGEREELGGSTKDGKLHGDYMNAVSLFESWIELKIRFQEGECIYYEMVENAEGEISKTKSKNPKVCSFYQIEETLQYVN